MHNRTPSQKPQQDSRSSRNAQSVHTPGEAMYPRSPRPRSIMSPPSSPEPAMYVCM